LNSPAHHPGWRPLAPPCVAPAWGTICLPPHTARARAPAAWIQVDRRKHWDQEHDQIRQYQEFQNKDL
jgi:hypothetical protein